jgi:hypothetical protein
MKVTCSTYRNVYEPCWGMDYLGSCISLSFALFCILRLRLPSGFQSALFRDRKIAAATAGEHRDGSIRPWCAVTAGEHRDGSSCQG